MPDPNRRTLKDELLKTTKAAPAAAGSNYHDSIRVGEGPHRERLFVRVEIPALPALENAKTLTVKLQDSADNVTFTDIEPASSADVVGAGGVGASAANFDLPIPQNAAEYIRLRQDVQTSGGDNTAKTITSYLVS
jgi:hypothetical protein